MEETHQKKLDTILDGFAAAVAANSLFLLRSLRELRRNIADLMAGTSEINNATSGRLVRDIQALVEEFKNKIDMQLREELIQSDLTGQESVNSPLALIGLIEEQPEDRDRTSILVTLAGVIAASVASDLVSTIGSSIRLGSLSGQSVASVTRRISQVIGATGRKLRGVAARAIAAARNAQTLAFNTAASAAQKVVAAAKPGAFKKRWVSVGDNRVRPAHLSAHIQTFDNPIPIRNSFRVGGELLRFPRDPRGSPGNIINCRCWVVTVPPGGATRGRHDRAVA